MSSYEHSRGRLRPFNSLQGESLEETCERFVNDRFGPKILERFESAEEAIRDELYDDAIIANNTVYEVIENSTDYDECDFYDAHYGENGDLIYNVLFYNGGMGLSEAIEEAIDTMRK